MNRCYPNHFWNWLEYCRLEKTCCHLNSCEKPTVKTGVNNLRRVIIIIIIIKEHLTQQNKGMAKKRKLLERNRIPPNSSTKNAMRTNHIKARIDKTQQNRKNRLCGDRDETINHIISECKELAQKEYKTRHDWIDKEIHWEMYKKFKFDHTNKWYMHNPAPVVENNTLKLLLDFDIHTDHQISSRRPVLKIVNKIKRTCKIVDFAVLADQRIKLKECEKKVIARELKKTMEHEGDNYTNCNWYVWNNNKRITKGTGGLGSWRTSGNLETTTLLRTPRILRRVLETWGNLLSLKLHWKTIS